MVKKRDSVPKTPAPRKAGVKQRNAASTKAAILAAAQSAFATEGYANVGVREIAAAAGVDRALIVRYFGSKEALFEAALTERLQYGYSTDIDRENFGKEAVRNFLGESGNGPSPLLMMVMASADPTVRAVSMEIEERLVLKPLARWIGPPNGKARALNIIMLWSGFLLYLRLGLPSLRKITPATRKWLEDSIQALVDGDQPD